MQHPPQHSPQPAGQGRQFMVEAFPSPPVEVEQAAIAMAIVASGDEEAIAALGGIDLHRLPRPWDPATCPPPLRDQVWRWCDQVAAWINAQLLWRPTQTIPACWPAHPHIAHELPLLACQRLAASKTFDAAALEEWHRYTLAYFLDRLRDRLGDTTCRDGRHMDWPGRARHQSGLSASAAHQRGEHFAADTGMPNLSPAPPAFPGIPTVGGQGGSGRLNGHDRSQP